MKKALIYGLSAALLLASMTACGKSQTDQQTTEPEPPQMQAIIPEAETTPEPEPEPEETPAVPEPLSEDAPTESDETEDSQTPEETEGIGVVDPDMTPESVYVPSIDSTPEEIAEIEKQYEENTTVDETAPVQTNEEFSADFEKDLEAMLAEMGMTREQLAALGGHISEEEQRAMTSNGFEANYR